MEIFSSNNDFQEACREIDMILSLDPSKPAPHSVNEATFRVLLQSSLVLLCSKFEAFCENAAQEWVFCINTEALISCHLPIKPLLEHTAIQINDISDNLKHAHSKQKAVESLRQLAKLWSDEKPAEKIHPPTNFSYGKHGRKVLRKLWERIGLDELLDSFELKLGDESFLGDSQNIDFLGTFDSMVNKRNVIIHSDSSPSITIGDVIKYKLILTKFAEHTETHMNAKRLLLIEECRSLDGIFSQ